MVKRDCSWNNHEWAWTATELHCCVYLFVCLIYSFTHLQEEMCVLGLVLMNEVWHADGEKVNIFLKQSSVVHKLFLKPFSVLLQWSELVSNTETRTL